MNDSKPTSALNLVSVRRAVLVSVCIGLVGGFYFAMQPSSVSYRLAERLQQLDAPVSFAEITPFDWDHVYVFPPYTSHAVIQSSLGFEWNPLWHTTIEHSDGVCLVVFVKNKSVAHWFEHLRNQGDLLELTRPEGFSRQDANFEWHRKRQKEFSRLTPVDRRQHAD